MATFLGGLVVWAFLLALSGTVAVFAVRYAWETWQRIQRARRAAWWAANPHARGQARAADAIAEHNGYVDTYNEYGRYLH